MRWVCLVSLLVSAVTTMASAASCEKPLVAIIDTGADLSGSNFPLWSNPGETGLDKNGHDKSSNGIDDDGDGLVDDVHGWNFADDSNDLNDHVGHGTHIAGLIAERALAPTQLMILKYYDRPGAHTRAGASLRRAFKYAMEKGATVIHISGGGYERRDDEWELMKEAERRGILVVAASGNKKPGVPDRNFYPAAYPLTNIISIAATDDGGNVLPTTNVIPGKMNILERGLRILSLLPGGKRGLLTGTSQAAGIFTGKFLSERGRLCDGPTRIAEFFTRSSSHLPSTN